MKNLIGIVLAVTGFATMGSGDPTVSAIMLVSGGVLLLSGKPKRRGATLVAPSASKDYWSSITNRSYASYDEMRRAEDAHLANVYSDPRFR